MKNKTKNDVFYIELYVFPGDVLTVELVKEFKLFNSNVKLSEVIVIGELCNMMFAMRDRETGDVKIVKVLGNDQHITDTEKRIIDVIKTIEHKQDEMRFSCQDITQAKSINDIKLPYYSFKVFGIRKKNEIPNLVRVLCHPDKLKLVESELLEQDEPVVIHSDSNDSEEVKLVSPKSGTV